MFCGECGTKNTSGSNFCEHCGAKLEVPTNVESSSTAQPTNTNEQPVQATPNQAVNTIQTFNDNNSQPNNEAKGQTAQSVQPAKPMDKKTKTLLIIIGVVLAILAGAYYYVGTLVTPEKIAENYFNAIVENDAEKIYSFIDVEESPFTTENMFKKVIKNSTDKDSKAEIVNYQVGQPQYEDLTKMTATVTITYVVKESEKSETMDIKLTKAKGKKWLLYDNWLVSTAAYTVSKDFEIRVQPGSTVTIEGEKVGKKYLDKENSTTNDVYIIPTMFAGKYKINVKLLAGIETEELVNIKSKTYYYPSVNSSTLTKKSKNNLEKQILKDLQVIYDNAIAKKNFDDFKSNFEYPDADLTELKNTYNELINDLSTTIILTKNKFNEATISSLSVYSDNTFSVYASTKSDYTVSYQTGGETKTHNDTSTNSVRMYYSYVDGQFKLTNAKYLETYFSRY